MLLRLPKCSRKAYPHINSLQEGQEINNSVEDISNREKSYNDYDALEQQQEHLR